MIATTPVTPYYAVIFTSIRNDDNEAYELMAEQMSFFAAQQSVWQRENMGLTHLSNCILLFLVAPKMGVSNK